MSFIRPDLRAGLMRWREVAAGAGLVLLGLLLLANRLEGDWMRLALAAVFVLAGAALIAIGLPRGRFRGAEEGPGVVAVREGRIGYMGPVSGGTVGLDEITAIEADGPPPMLILHRGVGPSAEPPLVIPLGARGAEMLFDVLIVLPGLDGAMLARAGTAEGRVLLWKREGAPPPLAVLDGAAAAQRRRLR